MNTRLEELIEEIHASNLYGIVLEAGCGAAIGNSLLSVDGASKSIYYMMQPYNKDKQNELFGDTFKRSVSKEYVIASINGIKKNPKDLAKVNFILSASFQLGDTEKGTMTHGYIGLWTKAKDITYVIHVSIPENNVRIENFSLIAEIGIRFLYSLGIVGTKELHGLEYIDDYSTDQDSKLEDEICKTLLLKNLSESITDSFLVFKRDGTVIRFEDFTRNKKAILLQKGSYDPIHEGHIDIFNKSKEHTGLSDEDLASAFLISMKRFDKPPIEAIPLYERIKKINSLGYDVVVQGDLLFLDTINTVNIRWHDKTLYLPIGKDTANRIIDFEVDLAKKTPGIEKNLKKQDVWISLTARNRYRRFNGEFLVADRKDIQLSPYFDKLPAFKQCFSFLNTYKDTGVSSTKIRNKQWENKI
jgi:hypothetical protein